MALLLCIDTAVAESSVCLAENGTSIAVKRSPDQKESASWIHIAIRDLLRENGVSLPSLQGIALSGGPGSYTGLRVGMATAKGLCYAAGLPLMLVDTLQMMAAAATHEPAALLCPMIDARRMEVFTAIYNRSLEPVVPYQPVVLERDSFAHLLAQHAVLFFGNGSAKFRGLTQHPNAVFRDIFPHAGHLARLAAQKWIQRDFTSLAYAEPFYGKAFFDPRN